jgi:hypothetical protein
MKYESNGYMYILTERLTVKLFKPSLNVVSKDICISQGTIVIEEGFKWDGATCAIDTPDFMRGSCVHDALYTLILRGKLPTSFRSSADKVLFNLCREDGMTLFRASYVYAAVRLFGAKHVSKG